MIARMAFSAVAREEKEWDKPLPQSREWEEWLEQLEELEGLSFPRGVKGEETRRAELHVFADASERGYAAAAYLRCWGTGGGVSVRLVAAKAHVAPKKQQSIPRLELLGAVLAVALKKQVLQALKQPIEKVLLWSDSVTVLYWIANTRKKMQAFVHNKVGKIHQLSSPLQWGWVPSAENPADLPTKGTRLNKLGRDSLWQRGPPFLGEREDAFPPQPPIKASAEAVAEMRKEEQVFVGEAAEVEGGGDLVDWGRFSTWKKLLNTFTRIFRVWGKQKSLARERAETFLLQQAQSTLKAKWEKNKGPEGRKALGLTQLVPFVDERGLLRAGTRLQYMQVLPRDMREPILLERTHRVAEILLRHYHQEVLKHVGGASYTLSQFLGKFWCPGARALAKRVVTSCVRCRRRLALKSRPPQAPLPHFRVPGDQEEKAVFSNTAVDCAGPFKVRRGRTVEQYFLLLLTCCQTRAVRLEWLSDLSTDAFLMALARAEARGVQPRAILSDNGSNFDGANKLLAALWGNLPLRELEQRKPHVKWRFNPPYAPHYGGVFERLIGAAKAALYHALPQHHLFSLEQLVTAFAQVEKVLNNRPLTYVSGEDGDLTPLTPNHFLHGMNGVSLLPPQESTPLSLVKRWNQIVRFQATCWDRFAKEVVPFLRLHSQHQSGGRDFQVGDVVACFLPNRPDAWPLGRISAVFPGKDGRIRTVEVAVPGTASDGGGGGRNKQFRRDVGAIVLLLPQEA